MCCDTDFFLSFSSRLIFAERERERERESSSSSSSNKSQRENLIQGKARSKRRNTATETGGWSIERDGRRFGSILCQYDATTCSSFCSSSRPCSYVPSSSCSVSFIPKAPIFYLFCKCVFCNSGMLILHDQIFCLLFNLICLSSLPTYSSVPCSKLHARGMQD